MTIDGGEPGLEVPVSTVGPRRRDRRRAAIVDPRRTQLVLVGMSDGAVSGVDVGELGSEGPNSAGWLP